jgi:antibiotic biosynthesis monooxygenase (ABM) superfamily enzyme
MKPGIILVVQLFIQVDQEVKFQQFEREAIQIMQKYHGQIEKVIRPIHTGQKNELPYEVHIVWFPSMEQFEAYRKDPDLAQLADLRQSAISRTEIMIGQEDNPYP